MLETAYARAIQRLLTGELVGIIEGLVLDGLKTRLPAHDSRLVREWAQRVRSIRAGLLLYRVPSNEVRVDTVEERRVVTLERFRHHRESAWRGVERVPVRGVTGAIGVYHAAHVIELHEEILLAQCCPEKRHPGRIISAAATVVYRGIAVPLVLFPYIQDAVIVAILNRGAEDDGA